MAEVELKVVINGVELEFEGEYNDMVKFYNLIKKDFLDKDEESEEDGDGKSKTKKKEQ